MVILRILHLRVVTTSDYTGAGMCGPCNLRSASRVRRQLSDVSMLCIIRPRIPTAEEAVEDGRALKAGLHRATL